MPIDEQMIDELMRLVGTELQRRDDAVELQKEAFLHWLAEDLRDTAGSMERARDERAAELFARRAVARQAAERAMQLLPRRELRYRGAPVIATVAQALPHATREHCAVVLDLAAAAGTGRVLWDEPCDSWLEIPHDLPASQCIALRVAGDSMVPVLTAGDVILIKLNAPPAVNDLVVARLADDGFVVKRVAALAAGQIELASFNPDYAPIMMHREPSSILGTVIARFTKP